MKQVFNNQKVTFYFTGDFLGDIQKIECKLHEINTQDYAQYKDVPYCVYTKKRARTKRKYLKAYKPQWLIVNGWDTPAPESTKVLLRRTENATVSTYSCSMSNPQSYDSLLSAIPEDKILFKTEGL